MQFPGGKEKCFHQVINLLPPHDTYIESHLGGGAVLRHKRPAHRSIGIDLDTKTIASWHREFPHLAEFRLGDAVEELRTFPFSGNEVVYADPPYLPSVRRRARIYRYDYTELDHRELLKVLLGLPCAVIISGYESALYNSEIGHWNRVEFRAKTHRETKTEVLWFNYPQPNELHDTRFLGRTFREREVIRRRLERLKSRLAHLPPQQQSVLRDFLHELERGRHAKNI